MRRKVLLALSTAACWPFRHDQGFGGIAVASATSALDELHAQVSKELRAELEVAKANLEVELDRVLTLQARLRRLDPLAAAAQMTSATSSRDTAGISTCSSPADGRPIADQGELPGRCNARRTANSTAHLVKGAHALGAELGQEEFEALGEKFLLEHPCPYSFPQQGVYPNEWACDMVEIGGRDGSGTDGSYRLCRQPELFADDSCIVYSFGLANDPSFDVEMANTTSCSIYAFDKAYRAQQEQHRLFGWTLRDPRTEKTPSNYHYIPIWLHGREPGLEAMTLRLAEVMKLLGHRHVDVLKMDIECAEFERGLVETICDIAQPTQLALEMHGYGSNSGWDDRQHCGVKNWIYFLNELHRCGYRRTWSTASGMNPALLGDLEWPRCQTDVEYCRSRCTAHGAENPLVFYTEVSFLRVSDLQVDRDFMQGSHRSERSTIDNL